MRARSNEIAVRSNRVARSVSADDSKCSITSIGMDNWLMLDEEEGLLLNDAKTESPPEAPALDDEEAENIRTGEQAFQYCEKDPE